MISRAFFVYWGLYKGAGFSCSCLGAEVFFWGEFLRLLLLRSSWGLVVPAVCCAGAGEGAFSVRTSALSAATSLLRERTVAARASIIFPMAIIGAMRLSWACIE